GTRLAEQLAPDLFVLGHRHEEALLLLLAAPVHDRGAAHADADDVERARNLVAAELLVDHLGLGAAQAREAVLDRPGGGGPSRLAQPGAPLVVLDLGPGLAQLVGVAFLDGLDPG